MNTHDYTTEKASGRLKVTTEGNKVTIARARYDESTGQKLAEDRVETSTLDDLIALRDRQQADLDATQALINDAIQAGAKLRSELGAK